MAGERRLVQQFEAGFEKEKRSAPAHPETQV